MNYRIFIVEDHPVMRDSLSMYIDRQPDLEVCGAVASAEEALARIAEDADDGIDLILIDVSLPGMSGIDLVKRLQEQRPLQRCLVISGHTREYYARLAMEAGAAGYVMKGNASAVIQEIHRALNA